MKPPTGHPAFLESLMDAAVDAIIIIDRQGTVLRFNRAAERLFGYRADEVVGGNVSRLMPEPNRGKHDGYLARYLETGKAAIIGKGRVEKGLRKNGQVFPMRLSVGEAIEGDTTWFVGIIHDLTQQVEIEEKLRKLEQQLFHADRLVTLGELTAGIAHEINQPLTAIAAYADAGRQLVSRSATVDEDLLTIFRSASVDEDLLTICGRIGEQSRRAAAVVARLRKLVQAGGASKASHDLNEIVHGMLPLFDHEVKNTGFRITFEPAQGLPSVFVDDIQIQQVLVNLVKNSLDALEGAGRTEGQVSVRVDRRDDVLAISVEDDGPGVPPQEEARLFEPFHTSKPKGVGLGLSICRSIAAVHGGTLLYQRAESGGARFVLTLPLASIG